MAVLRHDGAGPHRPSVEQNASARRPALFFR